MTATVRRRRPQPVAAPACRDKRFYCPACGMVRPDLGVEPDGDEYAIRKHYINRPGPWPKGTRLPIGEPLAKETCRGGAIDLVKDRAP